MSRRRSLLLLATSLAAALVTAAAVQAAGARGTAAPSGAIAFVSDRATADPGEIYALAPGAAPRDLSHSPYADVLAAASPVGRAFAFWSDRAGPWRLFISTAGGGLRSVSVGSVGEPFIAPLFSADGTQLIASYQPPSAAVNVLRLALVDVRSGAVRRLPAACELPPSWSPDGLLIACRRSANRVSVTDLHGRVRFSAPGSTALWAADGRLAVAGAKQTAIMSASGAVLARLDGVAQAWSSDGRLLALAKPGSLLLVQPGRSAAVRVVDHGADNQYYGVQFTPDGRYVSFSGSHTEPEIAPVAGGAARPLPAGFAGAWSRAGRYAFAIAGPTTVTIKVGDRFGHGARSVGRFPFDDHGDFGLAWSGDGSRLIFYSTTREHTDLWAMQADGTAPRRLTSNGQNITSPAWSHDGTRLAYSTAGFSGGLCGYCGGNVGVADAQGRQLSLVPGPVPGQQSSDGTPTWSSDGTQLAVSDDYNGGVSVVRLDGSGRAQIVAPDGAFAPVWSPDGTAIAYVNAGAVWVTDPTGANQRRLPTPGVGQVVSVAWSPDSHSLALSTAKAIFLTAVDGTGAPRLVTAAESPGRPSFSPDGQWLAFAAQAGTLHPYQAIYEVGLDGSGLRRLTSGPFDSFDPAWQPVTAGA